MKVREIIRRIGQDGWYHVRTRWHLLLAGGIHMSVLDIHMFDLLI